MAGGNARQPVVLLVEDDPADVMLTREAFAQSQTPCQLHAVSDADQAMNFLRRTHGFAGAPRPGLILLDLDLPGRGGLEFLAEVKADAGLLTIPVVVLTSSHAQRDIQRCYSLHANAYVTKASDFEGLFGIIQQVAGCFLGLIELPAQEQDRAEHRSGLTGQDTSADSAPTPAASPGQAGQRPRWARFRALARLGRRRPSG